MKRSIFIVCLLILSLVARATDVEHDFRTAGASLTLKSGNKIGCLDDIVYTCFGSSTFTYEDGAGGICIKISKGDSIVISPAQNGLQQLVISNYPRNISMQVSISTDSIAWTPVAGTQVEWYKTISGISGNYYVSIKNTYSAPIFIPEIVYTLNPCPNCHPVVAP